MQVGMATIFQNPENQISDGEVYRNELRLANLAEPLGFDSIWGVEHHFTDYTMCPDVMQFLTYMAGRTKQIKLGSMVVVLPWHDPMRVAEEIVDAGPHLGRPADPRHGSRRRTRRVRRVPRSDGRVARTFRRSGADGSRRPRAGLLRVQRQTLSSSRAQTSGRSPRKRSRAARTRRRSRPSRSRSWRASASAFW